MKSETVVPIRAYLLVFITLLALTATTAGVAFIDLGAQWNAAVALAIAVIKALLVILFFMHVFYSRPLTWIFVSAGFVWLVILFALTLADYDTRDVVGPGPVAAVPASAPGAPRPAIGVAPRVSK